MIIVILSFMSSSCLRKGEEPKAPRHASAAATRDSNLPYVTATCLYSQQYYISFIHYYTFLFFISQILTYLITQLILKLNSLKNSIPKTTLSLPSSKILKKLIIFLPLISTLTGPVSIYIILSLYNIRSPKIVTNRYRFSLSLYSNPILLTAISNI